MNLRKYIIIINLLLSAWLLPVLGQDYVDVVCQGDTGRLYYVQGHENSTYSWTINGGTIVENKGDSIYVDWGEEPGEYQMKITERSEYGCLSTPKFATVLITEPVVELGEDAYICEGENFTITPEGDFASIQWHDSSTSETFTTGTEGIISAVVTDEYGCAWEDEMYLEVKPKPYVNLGQDTSLCGEQSLYLNAGNDGVNYEWSTGDVSQEIQIFQGQQRISVDVEDIYGCTNSDTVYIRNCDPNTYFSDIMTAITPSNQDGRNDYWIIEKLQAYPDAVVDIYDRWGRLVWRSEPGYPTPWDGRNLNGREVPMGSYQFIILLNFGDDERVNGAVTVIR